MDSIQIIEKEPKVIVNKEVIRDKILAVEEAISKLPGAMFGDNKICPLTHVFTDGVYVREIFIPKGVLGVGKIHKHQHANFLMKGEVSVLTEFGVERLKAPQSMVSLAGTKRIVFTHEDTIWITIHANPDNLTDLDKLEELIIAKNYAELGLTIDENIEKVKLIEFINELQKGDKDEMGSTNKA
jgi:hypothetical protein